MWVLDKSDQFYSSSPIKFRSINSNMSSIIWLSIKTFLSAPRPSFRLLHFVIAPKKWLILDQVLLSYDLSVTCCALWLQTFCDMIDGHNEAATHTMRPARRIINSEESSEKKPPKRSGRWILENSTFFHLFFSYSSCCSCRTISVGSHRQMEDPPGCVLIHAWPLAVCLS